MGQDKMHRINQMRCRSQETLAFLQRLTDQFEFIIFEITQAAVNKFGRGRRGMRRQIVLFDEQYRRAAYRCIARNCRPVNTAADDEKIVDHWLPYP